MNPMKACNWDQAKIKFPIIAQPKIDGVRALTTEIIGMTGRSLKPHANNFVNERFCNVEYAWLDGELAIGDITDSALCRNTTSAVNTIIGTPDVHWWVFDDLSPSTRGLPYHRRYEILLDRINVAHMKRQCMHAHVVESLTIISMNDLIKYENYCIDNGFEGVILRDPKGFHKQGRSTVREGGFMRIKRFIEEEFLITGFEEGEHNANEQQTNELGYAYRTSHQENKVPNGMIGALLGIDLKTKEIIKVAAGCLTAAERKFYSQNPDKLVNKIGKYKHFPKGVKDKPRFPTFQSFRAKSDME